jgi:Carboxypeptidase regulatory-like domain/TonB dependent receptor
MFLLPRALLTGMLFLAMSGFAQVDRAALTGTVMDASGASIPGAKVRLVETSTGLGRDVATKNAGFYYIGSLPVGTYRVTISKDAFQTVEYPAVEFLVGETRTLNTQMQIASTSQEAKVEAESTPLAETSAELGGVVTPQQMANLPLNGRNWASLMTLIPGAIDTGSGGQSTIRFAGRANDENNFNLDGTDWNGVMHQYQNANFRLQVPTESIGEFRVNSMLYTAAEGGTSGANVEVVSRSGSNVFHGSIYEFFRNDKLDARSTFDPSTLPPLRLNQFGVSSSGAILKNKLFFFANYEGLRQVVGQTLIANVPSDSFRASVLAKSPNLAPLLAAYPEGTVPVNLNVSQRVGSARQTVNEDSGLIRIDYRLNDANTFFARYNIDQGVSSVPKGNLLDRTIVNASPMNGSMQFVHIFSSSMFNDLKLDVNRTHATTTTGSNLYNVSGITTAVTVPGLETLNSYGLKVIGPTTYSLVDHWNLVKGRNTFQAGVEIRDVHYNLNNVSANVLAFASLPAFAADQLNQLTLVDAIPMHGLHEWQFAGYAQDEVKLAPNLTATVGLRYDFFNRFNEIYGRDLPFDLETCGGYCAYGSEFSYPVTDNFQPRAGLAWAPAIFKGKTVIRSGFGLYSGQGALDDLTAPNDNTGTRYVLSSANAPGLTFPSDSFIAQANHTAVAPRALQRNRGDGSVAQWGLQVQSELPGGFILDTGYLGSHGYKLFARNYINVIDPATGLRPLPAFGQIDIKRTDGVSSFNAWQTSIHKQWSSGWIISANYMWSHSLNDGAVGGGEADYPEIASCRSCDYSDSDQDVRHSFTMNTVYELPFGRNRKYLNGPGAGRVIFGGWQLSAIGTARTGIPVNITVDRSALSVPDGNIQTQRPNLIAGVSLTPSNGQTIQQWINPAAFVAPVDGTWGNAGRNLVRAPGIWQADVSLGKKLALTERASLEFQAAAFNLFNRAQLGSPNGDISSPTFGRITNTINPGATGTGTPRQFQFMLRLSY